MHTFTREDAARYVTIRQPLLWHRRCSSATRDKVMLLRTARHRHATLMPPRRYTSLRLLAFQPPLRLFRHVYRQRAAGLIVVTREARLERMADMF